MTAPVRHAILLAGGRGTRLGSLTEQVPKPLLPVAGEPFLFHAVRHLARNGVTDIVVSTGYQAGKIAGALGDGSRFGVAVDYAEEKTPLGTGGGVKLASAGLPPAFWVVNADTILDCPLQKLAATAARNEAQAGIFLRRMENVERYGMAELKGEMITAYSEKSGSAGALISGGVYLFTQAAATRLPDGASSLERDLFPVLAAEGLLAGQVADGFFLDIGLPDTYALAQTAIPEWERTKT